MSVINNPLMEKYKTYFTEKVKGKDGVTRPITKVKYIKTCPQCGGSMNLMNYKAGSNYKPFIAKWWCESRICGHSETEPTQHEVVKLNLEMDSLKYGECIHHENLAACDICNGNTNNEYTESDCNAVPGEYEKNLNALIENARKDLVESKEETQEDLWKEIIEDYEHWSNRSHPDEFIYGKLLKHFEIKRRK